MATLSTTIRPPLVREYGIVTTSDHKVKELEASFGLYGIRVKKLNPLASPDDPNHWDNYVRYSDREKNFFVKGIIFEQTYLKKHGSNKDAEVKQLELVDHISELNLQYEKKDKTLETIKFIEKTKGYIDLTKRSEDIENKYDWDDIFVVESCHKTYFELQKLGQKVSSRDKNISKIITQFIHYDKLENLHHHPLKFGQPIDFSQDPYDYINSIPEFNSEYITKMKLYNIVVTGLNQGMMFRAAKTRREKAYWVPGLNAGIPLTPKPNDPTHELTFQFHDFSHFTMPDLVFDGKVSELTKLVYIGYRLMSECITLVLADMIFVNSIFKSGYNYKTANQRKIYPVFQKIEENMNIDVTNPKKLEPFIRSILWGSYEHCFYGDSTRWIAMMDKLNEEEEILQNFGNKYDKYFMEDFRWTKHNFEDMAQTPEVYQKWWNHIKEWRKLGYNLELKSVSEFIEEHKLSEIFMDPENKEDFRKKTLDKVFEAVYSTYIKRLFESDIMTLYNPEIRLQNRFIRYMMGQSIIFFKYDFFHESPKTLEKIDQYLRMNIDELDLDKVNTLRSFYNNYLKKLELANLITPDDEQNFEEICPIFSPMYVDYDHIETDISIGEFVDKILST